MFRLYDTASTKRDDLPTTLCDSAVQDDQCIEKIIDSRDWAEEEELGRDKELCCQAGLTTHR